MIVILVSPSCAGKSFIEKALAEEGYESLVSITTRTPRSGEVNGKDYHFVSVSEFQEMLYRGEIVEHNIFSGNYYGTGLKSLESVIEKQSKGVEPNVAVVLDPNGVVNLTNYLNSLDNPIPYAVAFIDVAPEVAQERFIKRFEDKIIELLDKGERDNQVFTDVVNDYAKRMALILTAEPTWKSKVPFDILIEKSSDRSDVDRFMDKLRSYTPPARAGQVLPDLDIDQKVDPRLFADVKEELRNMGREIIYEYKLNRDGRRHPDATQMCEIGR
jgi:guanylate kinase